MKKTSFDRQPKAFYMIFLLEFWERFGFNGFNGILSLFFVKALGYSQAEAFATFGAFNALLCALMSIGGFVGDRILGTKRTILLGAVFLMTGYFFLAFADKSTVFYGLAIICAGNGFFKPNPSSLLSKLYDENDPRLHGAFTMYYMAINLGSLVAILILPGVSSRFGWNYAFILSGAGMIIAITNFVLMWKTVKHYDSIVGIRPLRKGYFMYTMLVTFAVIGVFGYLLKHIEIARLLLWIICVCIVFLFFKYMFKEHGISRKKMFVAFILMIEAVIFFTLYQQMPTSLNFFAINNVDTRFFGIDINPQSYQSLNAFWIVVMSPCLAFLYKYFGMRGKDMSLAGKFSSCMTVCAISFLMLYFCRFFNTDGIVSPWWLVWSYFFQSTGELLISALGLAMVAELVPGRIVGFIMGMWFLTLAISGVSGAYLASFTAPPEGISGAVNTLNIYTGVFLKIGIGASAVAAIMWLTSPLLNRFLQKS